MVLGAAELIGRNGVAATSFGAVLEHSGAPRGSICHHFPDGKSQLVVEAVEVAGDYLYHRLESVSGSMADMIAGIGDIWRLLLVANDYEWSCPVLAAGTARTVEPAAADVAGKTFVRWRDLIARRLIDEGIDAERAPALANLMIASIEGAVGMCRSTRSVEPLDQVVAELQLLAGSLTSPTGSTAD